MARNPARYNPFMRTGALLTVEDFARVAPVLGPCELIKGEIVQMSPGGMRHSKVTGRAFLLLAGHAEARGLGHVLTGEAGVIVARHPDTVRGADVAFISYQRQPKGAVEDGFLSQPPELVIEVLGKETSWQKMEAKIADYHGLGVDLVWILDPHTETLRAYPRGSTPVVLRDTDEASADPFVPGFAVRVSRFFEI
jgi:Uma2 family endonuclease